ncbi:LysR family transcriptional regulator [Fulvimarina endophytica]|uniref:LysR family transcriptional regulator n=1 Tax=Fulvimarina endophytica TaxID=2293836 RepID=A0A371X5M0_9HYPH|nr:LysR substrate-binding domain-containing protein [Fulvimarina endophytica]RFC64519.1 LysR family transcriptional regulator [Fulvimarina endophytica]
MRFDLADLRLFIAVLDAGSITRGAGAANLSLAAASERLRDMEIASGVPLLLRNRRGVVPTRAGDTLAHHARVVLRQVGAMQADLSGHARGFRGSVRLLANSAAISGLLPERLGPFLARHPGTDVDLAERPSPDIAKVVAGGRAEIGIVSDAADTSGLETRPFALDRLILVAPRDHTLASAKRVAFATVAEEPMVGFDGALQVQLREQAERIGVGLRPRILLRTFDGLARMVADGVGIAVMPQFAARRAKRSMPLALLQLTDPWAVRRLLVCTRGGSEPGPLTLSLLEHLASPGNPE